MTAAPPAAATTPNLDDDWSDDPRRHPLARPGALSRQSAVLAVVPHFHCEAWLGQCLDSLVKQTHRLQGIAVIDDGTGAPPIEIVRDFPEVTLLASNANVGPYRLSQQVIAATAYDAYCFQDADDWSMPARVERQLLEAERSGAESIGCQGLRLISGEGEVVPQTFPLDVNAALEAVPVKHVLMHPSSIVTRDLVMRAGGYAMGLRFGGDTEFEHRATYAGRIVNVPDFLYVIRNRPESLTSSAATGLESPERQRLRAAEHLHVHENRALVAEGRAPNLEPLETAEPVEIAYISGPRLRGVSGKPWPL